MANTKFNTKKMVQLAILVALLIVLDLTGVGMIITPVIAITTLGIPVVMGGILLGPAAGGFLGVVFGLLSMWKATTIGVSPMDVAFSPFKSGDPLSSVILCFAGRILLGVVAGLLYKVLKKFIKQGYISTAITAVVSCVVCTATVMASLWLLFPDLQVTFKAVLLTICSVNFLIETGVTVLFAVALAKVMPILGARK